MAEVVPAQGAATGPRMLEVAGGSMLSPQAVRAAEAPGGTGGTAGAATEPAPPRRGVLGAVDAAAGSGLLARVMALIPLAAGVTQAVVGFMITKGTIPIVAAPLIGGWPRILVGTLVAATSAPTIMAAVARLTGRTLPGV